MLRRTFLKLGTVSVGGLLLSQYAEPLIQLPSSKDWIEDYGDYFKVIVPAGKSFSNESFDKPTIFVLGQDSKLERVSVKGYTNIYGNNNVCIKGIDINCSSCISKEAEDRAILKLVGFNHGVLCDSYFVGNGKHKNMVECEKMFDMTIKNNFHYFL